MTTPLRIASTGAPGDEKGQLRSLRAARMVPSALVEDLSDIEPEFIELPDVVEEPLPIVLPEPVVELEPVPIVLPEPVVVDGLVVDVDDDGVLVVPVVVVVVVVPVVPLDGIVVLVLPDGVVVVLDGVVVVLDGVVVLLDGVVVVLDCAMAAPPPINKDAAAMAVVVFKNEPMVYLLVWLKRRAHRTAVCQRCTMSDACPIGNGGARIGVRQR